MTDQTPDTIRALADRLERRADIEDVGEVRYPQTEETDAAYEDVPEVTWEEMREIVGLLREAASTLRALADQGQRAAESLCRCGVPRGVPHYCSSLDRAFVGAAAPAPTGAPPDRYAELQRFAAERDTLATKCGERVIAIARAFGWDGSGSAADYLERMAPDPATPAPTGAPTAEEAGIREYVIRICDACYALRGQMCHEPGCVFCRRTMAEVGAMLDALLIRPIVNGERLDLHPLSGGPDHAR